MENIWDLKSIPDYYSNKIAKYEYKEYKEDSVNVKESDNYKFTITDVNSPILYSNGYIYLESKITKNDGSSIGTDNVTFVNGGNLFKEAKLKIVKTSVDSNDEGASLLHHINGLINFTKDYSNSEATNMLYYIDTSESPNKNKIIINNPDGDVKKGSDIQLKENASYNKGFRQRWILTKNSNIIKFWIPLRQLFGFFNDFRKLIFGVPVIFEFRRNSSNDMLYTDTLNPNYKIIISAFTLWLPIVELYPSIDAEFKSMALNSKPIEITWCSAVIIKGNTETTKGGSCHIRTTSDEVLSVSVIPQYIEKENNQNQNNMIFDNLDLIKCHMTCNNNQIPLEQYEMSFKDGELDYNRCYSELLAAGLNTHNTESGCLISYENYGRLYPIIHFNLSNHPEYVNIANLRLEFKWELRTIPNKPYRFYFIVNEKRRGLLDMGKNKFDSLESF